MKKSKSHESHESHGSYGSHEDREKEFPPRVLDESGIQGPYVPRIKDPVLPPSLEASHAEISRLTEKLNTANKRISVLLEPLQFEYEPGRPLMVVKMGSDARGWIPAAHHFDHVRRVLKASGADKKANILMMHYAILFEQFEPGGTRLM